MSSSMQYLVYAYISVLIYAAVQLSSHFACPFSLHSWKRTTRTARLDLFRILKRSSSFARVALVAITVSPKHERHTTVVSKHREYV